jgi:hypothetical protein
MTPGDAKRLGTYMRARYLARELRLRGFEVLGAGDLEAGSRIWIAFRDLNGTERLLRFMVKDQLAEVVRWIEYGTERCVDGGDYERV